MKSLSERINWYKESETRTWKRVWYCVELSLIALSAFVVMAVILIYGDGTKLQPLLTLFTGLMGLSAICLAPSLYRFSGLRRWHIQLILLGLGCGTGISAVAAFLMLELQHINS